MAYFLKYMGPLQIVEVKGYGHFGHGDEKLVDEVTAGAFKDERVKKEGWEVRSDEPVVEGDVAGHLVEASVAPIVK